MDENTFSNDKTRMVCAILLDRRDNGLDVTLVAAVNHAVDDVIVEWLIDRIAFKTSKTNVHNISTEGFVAMPVERIL